MELVEQHVGTLLRYDSAAWTWIPPIQNNGLGKAAHERIVPRPVRQEDIACRIFNEAPDINLLRVARRRFLFCCFYLRKAIYRVIQSLKICRAMGGVFPVLAEPHGLGQPQKWSHYSSVKPKLSSPCRDRRLGLDDRHHNRQQYNPRIAIQKHALFLTLPMGNLPRPLTTLSLGIVVAEVRLSDGVANQLNYALVIIRNARHSFFCHWRYRSRK
jgi:hypothetical protein